MLAFIKYEQSSGYDDLIIPILYMPTPRLANPDDEVDIILRERQHFEWGDLRFVDLESNDMRRGVAKLAGQIVSAVTRPRLAVPRTSENDDTHTLSVDKGDSEDAPGFLDLIAEAEDAFPLFNVVLSSFTDLMKEVIEITTSATSDLQEANAAQRPASAKLLAARRFAPPIRGSCISDRNRCRGLPKSTHSY